MATLNKEFLKLKKIAERSLLNGDYDKAIELYTKAIEMDITAEERAILYSKRSQAYYQLFEKSIGIYETCVAPANNSSVTESKEDDDQSISSDDYDELYIKAITILMDSTDEEDEQTVTFQLCFFTCEVRM